jgi:hypothetical protein
VKEEGGNGENAPDVSLFVCFLVAAVSGGPLLLLFDEWFCFVFLRSLCLRAALITIQLIDPLMMVMISRCSGTTSIY